MGYWKETSNNFPEWPYPIHYEEEQEIETDVLVIGGGIAGCWAAISAARKGLKVAIAEKGATVRSGAGGPGCDHWFYPTTHPACNFTAEELTQQVIDQSGGYQCGFALEIQCRESYDTLLELEKMGGKVRDTDDEFKGAEFRDEETKFLFAYDYINNPIVRVWGATFKPAMKKECERLGVKIYDRVMVTSLLNEGGVQGARVVGATGVNNRTGEFMVFKAKATVLCTARAQGIWCLSTETEGITTFRPRTVIGDGLAMAWRAGAALNMMETTRKLIMGTGYSHPEYGFGNSDNTWYPCSMVDNNGKELPWVDHKGNAIDTVSQRLHPISKGGRTEGAARINFREVMAGVRKGEYALPFYADLPGMPEIERRVIWGLMIGNESKTKVPVLQNYTEAGFDANKDMLQNYTMLGGYSDPGLPGWRSTDGGSTGGMLVDWDMKTTVDGLYTAGDQLYSGRDHSRAATTGRYAGRKAADYAREANEPAVSREQIAIEKARVFAPIKRSNGIEWKELNAGIARIMQTYCGEYKTEALLNMGLDGLKDIEENWVPNLYTLDPHKLMRSLEDTSILTCAQIITHASLARKASSNYLTFYRLDYPEVDPPEWNKFITVHQENGKVKVEELPLGYWGPLKENYEAHNKDYTGVYNG